jgi:hypothetical protein
MAGVGINPLNPNIYSDPNSGCWLWVGSLNWAGYGRMTTPRGRLKTHRLSWEQHHGPIPSGLQVCHKCDVRSCCNPDHLFVGTNKDNHLDKVAKGRQAKGASFAANQKRTCARGERGSAAVLTEAQAIAIINDPRSPYVVGPEYGITHWTVRNIRKGVSWTHLSRPSPLPWDLTRKGIN